MFLGTPSDLDSFQRCKCVRVLRFFRVEGEVPRLLTSVASPKLKHHSRLDFPGQFSGSGQFSTLHVRGFRFCCASTSFRLATDPSPRLVADAWTSVAFHFGGRPRPLFATGAGFATRESPRNFFTAFSAFGFVKSVSISFPSSLISFQDTSELVFLHVFFVAIFIPHSIESLFGRW